MRKNRKSRYMALILGLSILFIGLTSGESSIAGTGIKISSHISQKQNSVTNATYIFSNGENRNFREVDFEYAGFGNDSLDHNYSEVSYSQNSVSIMNCIFTDKENAGDNLTDKENEIALSDPRANEN